MYTFYYLLYLQYHAKCLSYFKFFLSPFQNTNVNLYTDHYKAYCISYKLHNYKNNKKSILEYVGLQNPTRLGTINPKMYANKSGWVTQKV